MGKFQHKYGATFPVSAALYKKTQKLIVSVRQNPEGLTKRNEVVEIVNALTAEGLEYFFHYSLKIIGMNMIAKKAIKTGMAASKATVKLLSKKFIRALNDKQLLATVDFIDGFVSD
ncbi:MAG: hypothetical protein B6I20_11520 [Bacteroidetes bacterium 4572_117]|nr:MAG: hypothetical protein B6I20_11520 [Bacteroidetes bacterium 4572_117]